MAVTSGVGIRDAIWPAANAIILAHLKRMGWLDDAIHETITWSPDDIPNDLIEETQAYSFRHVPDNFHERIIHALLPRRYWYKKPEPRDPAKATRWRRARCRAGIN